MPHPRDRLHARRRRREHSVLTRRVLVAAFGDPGHAFPAIALSRALAARGNDVALETWERWREPVETLGIEFLAAEQYKVFPTGSTDAGEVPSTADAAAALVPMLEEMRPDLVVSDILTTAPALAAEVVGVRRATLVPHLWPVQGPDLPFFGVGLLPPRSALGRGAWRAAQPLLDAGLRTGRRELNEAREQLGLDPLLRFQGAISEELAIVATFPQLEYPRRWPRRVSIAGPLLFELPGGEPLPANRPGGDAGRDRRGSRSELPLVLVAPSTSKDPECRLIRVAFDALAQEPVRIVASSNRQAPAEGIGVPSNGALVDWLSYEEAMPNADLVICHGGHGTVARALACGTPVLVSPVDGDMAENGARAAWARCGLTLPRRLTGAATLRIAARRLLADDSFARRAGELRAWAARHDAGRRCVAEIERLLSA